jgi:hypothetical protein
VLDGVPQGEDTTLALCLITHVGVLLTHTDHDTAPGLDLNERDKEARGENAYPW